MKKILVVLVLTSMLLGCEKVSDVNQEIETISMNEEIVIELEEQINHLNSLNDDLKIENEKIHSQMKKIQQEKNDSIETLENYSYVIETLLKTPETYIITRKDIDFILRYIPQEWLISTFNNGSMAIAKGKLDQDEVKDIAVIIENNKSGDRELLLFIGNQNDEYDLKYKCEKAVLNLYAGGGFGNPLSNLSIVDNELNLNFYGGGFGRFFMDYKFKFITDDVKLIKATTGFHVPTEKDVFIEFIEEDYLLGKRTEQYLNNDDLLIETNDIVIKELKNITDFEPLMLQYEEIR